MRQYFKTPKKLLINSFLPIFIGLIFVAAIIYAWTEPSGVPPTGNIPAPLNIGDSTQYKLGALGIKGVFETDTNTNLAIISGKVGIGTLTPGKKLDVVGGEIRSDTGFCIVGASPECITNWPSGGGAANWKHYFITNATHNGDFDNDPSLAGGGAGAVNGDENGVPEANNFCSNDTNAIAGVSYHMASVSALVGLLLGIWDQDANQKSIIVYYNKMLGTSGSLYILNGDWFTVPALFWLNYTGGGTNNCVNWTSSLAIKTSTFSGSLNEFIGGGPLPVGMVQSPVMGLFAVCSQQRTVLCVQD